MSFRDYSKKSDKELFEEYCKAKKLYENLPNRLATKWLLEMNFLKSELFKRGIFEENFKPID